MAEEQREVPVTDVPHPLVDAVGVSADGQRWTVTESRARVVFLTPGRINLLNRAAAAGRRLALVTDEHSHLTPVFADVWRDSGARWVVRDARGGLREGFGGRRLGTVDEVWTVPQVQTVDDMAIGHLRSSGVDATEVIAIVSVRHPARQTTRLGQTLSGLAHATLGAPPRAWGMSEPVGEPWDPATLTDALRLRMPAETMVFAAGPGLAASITAGRSEHGVEEVTHAHLMVEPGPDELDAVQTRLRGQLSELAASSMPLVALLLARPGRHDLLRPPLLLAAPTPIALLVGAPAVRSLGLDPGRLHAEHGAEIVGRPRLPALLFRFGAEPQGWQELDAVVSALGPDVLPALGLDAAKLTTDRPPPTDGGSDARP